MNDFLDFFDYFLGFNHDSISDDLDFFYSLLNNDFLSDNFDFKRLSHSIGCLHDFFDNLRNFDNFLHSLNDRNRFFDDSLNYFMSSFDMVFDFLSISILDLRNYFLDYFFHFNDLRYLNNLLNDLLHYDWNLDDFLNNFFQ